MLILYVTKQCPNCGKVKRILNDKGYQYEVRDAERLPDECAFYNIESVPALRFGEGEKAVIWLLWMGMKRLDELLRKHGARK
jgi:glutaredoxin